MNDVIFFNFIFVYIEINVICAIMGAVIFFMVSPDMANNREVFAFRCLIAVYVVMLLTDCFTQLTYRHVITCPAIPLAIVYALYTAGFGAMAFYWFRFLEYRIDPNVRYPKKFWLIMALPLLVLAIFSFGSIKFGWIFFINDEGIFQRGPFFALQMIVSYMYFFVSAVHAMIEASKERSPIRKRQLLIVASYVIVPAAGAILQLIFSTGLPIVAPSVSICMVFMMISIQRGQSNRDALTGIDNRRSMDAYLESRIDNASEANPFYIYVIDANDFKSINDTYGHQEGDRALKLIAQALSSRNIAFERFVARFGGDEFVAIVDFAPEEKPDPAEFPRAVNEELEELCKGNELEFPVSVTAGWSTCTSDRQNPKTILREADEDLYRKKHKQNEEEQSA